MRPKETWIQDKLTNKQWAYVTLRFTLGINIFMHVLTRIISGVVGFAGNVTEEFTGSLLPAVLVKSFLLALPFIEFTIGLLMVAGLFTRYALIAGGFLITALTFGSTAKRDWGAAGTQLPYAIAFSLLLFALEHNRLRIKD